MRKKISALCILALALPLGYFCPHPNAQPNSVPQSKQTVTEAQRGPLAPAKFSLPTSSDLPKFTGTLAELMDQLRAIGDSAERDYFLLRTVVEMDPERLPILAGEAAKLHPATQLTDSVLETLLKQWAALEPASALAWARQVNMGDAQNKALGYVICGLSASNLRTAKELISSLEKPQRGKVLDAVALELAGKDPRAALEMLAEYPLEESASIDIMNAWVERDPAAAVATHEEKGWGTSQWVYTNWGRKDPGAAWAHATQLPEGSRDGALADVFEGWCQKDVHGAYEMFKTLSPKDQKEVCRFGNALYFAAQHDPASALAMMEARPARYWHMDAALLADGWASHDLPGAVHWADSLAQAPKVQEQAFACLGRGCAKNGAEQILEMAQQISSEKNRLTFLQHALPNKMTSEVLSRLSPTDAAELIGVDNVLNSNNPKTAISLLTQFDVAPNNPAWQNTAAKYTDTDPAAAYAWTQTLSEDAQAAALPGIVMGMAKQDPAAALAFAQQIANPEARQKGYARLMEIWVEKDPAALEAAWQQLPEGARQPALAQVLTHMADPVEAAKLSMSLQQHGSAADAKVAQKQLSSIGGRWAEQDSVAAIAWIPQLPDGEARTNFIEGIASHWANAPTERIQQWIKTTPASQGRDQVLETLVVSMSQVGDPFSSRYYFYGRSNPTEALLWAKEIQDETIRSRAYEISLRSLLEKNPTEGKAAVQAAPISAEMKAQLLK